MPMIRDFPSPSGRLRPDAAPLPPLPNFERSPKKEGAQAEDVFSSMMSGIGPIRKSANKVIEGLSEMRSSPLLRGSEQAIGVIQSLVNMLITQAVNQGMIPGGQPQGAPPTMGQGIPPVGA